MRLPVAAKIALQTAGATVGTPGSPSPPGGWPESRMCTSVTGDLGDPHHRVGVEVRLLDAAAVERDLAVERRGHRVDRAALHLRLDLIRVDRDPAVDRADEAVDPYRAVVGDRDLGHVRRVARVGEAHRDAARASRRQRRAPAGLGRRQLEDPLVAGRLPEERAPVLVRVLPRLVRQLVDEGLDDERVLGRARPSARSRSAPRRPCRPTRSARWGCRTAGPAARPSTCCRPGRRGRAPRWRRSPAPTARVNHAVGLPPASSARPEHVVRARTVEAVREVVLARPDHLHRPAADRLGDLDGIDDVVDLPPPPEAAAEERRVHRHPLDREPGQLARRSPASRPGSASAPTPCTRSAVTWAVAFIGSMHACSR